MWIEIIMQVVLTLFKNCPQERTKQNVERIVKNPTWSERRRLRLAMRQEADKQLDAYLDGEGDVALSSADKDYICGELCERLGIPT